ncbi:MAG: hypothetical protein ACFCVF_09900 [Kineosporiaceae bacterium]
MYRDYYDESDTWGLRNPYAPVPLLPEGRPRQNGMLLGLVGAGLAAVLPITGRASEPPPAPDAGLSASGTAVDAPVDPDADTGGRSL